MKLKDALIAWNPAWMERTNPEKKAWSDQIKVAPLVDNYRTRWANEYTMTNGGCCSHVKKMKKGMAKLFCFIEAMNLVIRDRVDPDAVHREFCKIEEYVDGLAPDCPGSRELRKYNDGA